MSSQPLTLWDHLVGPGATKAENFLMVTVAVLSTVGQMIYQNFILRDQNWVQIVAGALLSFDVFGGAVSNASRTTKRWYHRSGQTRNHQLCFTTLHISHMGIVAWLFGGPWELWVLYGLLLILSSLSVVYCPRYLKNPVASIWYMLVLVVWMIAPVPTANDGSPGMEWFIPILFLKLVLGHLVPDNPTEETPHEAIINEQID